MYFWFILPNDSYRAPGKRILDGFFELLVSFIEIHRFPDNQNDTWIL